jgi:hypothetical protein
MPYIKQDDRARVLRDGPRTPGELNFLISFHANQMLRMVTHGKPPSYHERSAIRAAITDASDEFYRRKMADYEDGAKHRNGDCYDPE